DAADLHHRRGGGIGQHHRHLEEHAEEVADVVGTVLGEAFRAVTALEQESLAGRDTRQRLLQVAGLACKNERRKGRELLLDVGQCPPVRIVRHLRDRLWPPAIGRPTFRHFRLPHAILAGYTRRGPAEASVSAARSRPSGRPYAVSP